jgi:GTP-binding protein
LKYITPLLLNLPVMLEIKEARFVTSQKEVEKCPPPNRPEYAFIGRSNVGKSSLINMLTRQVSLARTSAKPGKTQLINHFLINGSWYLVDLPGYGFAQAPKAEKEKWTHFIREYILRRINLCCLFVLIDIRHEPLDTDLEFLTWVGENQVPFAVVFTKADKLRDDEVEKTVTSYLEKLKDIFEPLPDHFITSANDQRGKPEMLAFIEKVNREYGT